jgi:hypothetical protein
MAQAPIHRVKAEWEPAEARDREQAGEAARALAEARVKAAVPARAAVTDDNYSE